MAATSAKELRSRSRQLSSTSCSWPAQCTWCVGVHTCCSASCSRPSDPPQRLCAAPATRRARAGFLRSAAAWRRRISAGNNGEPACGSAAGLRSRCSLASTRSHAAAPLCQQPAVAMLRVAAWTRAALRGSAPSGSGRRRPVSTGASRNTAARAAISSPRHAATCCPRCCAPAAWSGTSAELPRARAVRDSAGAFESGAEPVLTAVRCAAPGRPALRGRLAPRSHFALFTGAPLLPYGRRAALLPRRALQLAYPGILPAAALSPPPLRYRRARWARPRSLDDLHTNSERALPLCGRGLPAAAAPAALAQVRATCSCWRSCSCPRAPRRLQGVAAAAAAPGAALDHVLYVFGCNRAESSLATAAEAAGSAAAPPSRCSRHGRRPGSAGRLLEGAAPGAGRLQPAPRPPGAARRTSIEACTCCRADERCCRRRCSSAAAPQHRLSRLLPQRLLPLLLPPPELAKRLCLCISFGSSAITRTYCLILFRPCLGTMI